MVCIFSDDMHALQMIHGLPSANTSQAMPAEHHMMSGHSMSGHSGHMDAPTESKGSADMPTGMHMNMAESCYKMEMFMHSEFNDYFFLSGWLICNKDMLCMSLDIFILPFMYSFLFFSFLASNFLLLIY